MKYDRSVTFQLVLTKDSLSDIKSLYNYAKRRGFDAVVNQLEMKSIPLDMDPKPSTKPPRKVHAQKGIKHSDRGVTREACALEAQRLQRFTISDLKKFSGRLDVTVRYWVTVWEKKGLARAEPIKDQGRLVWTWCDPSASTKGKQKNQVVLNERLPKASHSAEKPIKLLLGEHDNDQGLELARTLGKFRIEDLHSHVSGTLNHVTKWVKRRHYSGSLVKIQDSEQPNVEFWRVANEGEVFKRPWPVEVVPTPVLHS